MTFRLRAVSIGTPLRESPLLGAETLKSNERLYDRVLATGQLASRIDITASPRRIPLSAPPRL